MKKILNQKGQAIFEFLIFIPFLAFLYTIFYTVGNSINGSIAEQKSVRGYFYTLVKGNSYLLRKQDLADLRSKGIRKAGFFSIAWSEKSDGENRYAHCFPFASMFKNASDEECNSKVRPMEGSSVYVRLFTAYGVCGAVYRDAPHANMFEFDPALQADATGCTLSTSNN